MQLEKVMKKIIDARETDTILFFSNSYQDACAALRVIGPAKHLGFDLVYGNKDEYFYRKYIPKSRAIIIQRDFCRDFEEYKKIVSLAHSTGVPIIYDIDDLIFALPPEHYDRIKGFYTEALLPMLYAIADADLVTVSTNTLREYILPFNHRVQVVPNFLEDSLWKINSYFPKNKDDLTIIGYMGGKTHTPDLKMALPALLKINEKYSGHVGFRFWGIVPPEELSRVAHVEWYKPGTHTYTEFSNYFQNQTADIVIAPLCDNLFNSCKSAIKYLEYGALGVPGVYSRLNPYSEIVEDGVDGFLATTTTEWVNSLACLIEDPDRRRNMIENAQKKITEDWLLSSHCQIHREVISRPPQEFESIGDYSKNLASILQFITEQTLEYHHPVQQPKQTRKFFQLNELCTAVKRVVKKAIKK
jgi:glycosyltransferase involved in cell wall biosynthesis